MYHSWQGTPKCLLVMLECVCTAAACDSSHSSLAELHLSMTEFRMLHCSNRWRQGQSFPFLWKHKELMETKVVLLSAGWQNSYQVLLNIVAAIMKKLGHAPWAMQWRAEQKRWLLWTLGSLHKFYRWLCDPCDHCNGTAYGQARNERIAKMHNIR